MSVGGDQGVTDCIEISVFPSRHVLQRSWFVTVLQIVLTNAAIAASSMAGH